MKTKYFLIVFGIFVFILGCHQNDSKKTKKPSPSAEDFLEKGSKIAQNTFLALSSELQRSMKDGGIENAIEYCNLNAIPITQKLSKEQKALIKRTSLRYRNPDNAPSEEEKEILLSFQNKIDNNEDLRPVLREKQDQIMFYSPIITQEMCLKCHGAKKSMPAYEIISSKYPTDLAFDYQAGDLRGMWSIALLPSNEK